MSVFAQQPGAVHFSKGEFYGGNNISNDQFTVAGIQQSKFAHQYYVLIEFSLLPSVGTRGILKQSGVELGAYLPGQAYLATIKEGFDFSTLKALGVRSVNAIPASYKIDPNLYSYKSAVLAKEASLMAIGFFPGINSSEVEGSLKLLGAQIVPSKFPFRDFVLLQYNPSLINNIANLPFVSYLHLQSFNDKPLNYKSTAMHGMSSLFSAAGRNLSGKNITVGVGDNAEISTHIDFTGRLINRVYSVPSFHGIHTSGTVAGGGILDTRHHGMAPRANIVSQWFSDVISNTPYYVADYNMIVTNNSYTSADDGCPGNGVYDVLSNYADVQMSNYLTVLHVFSAGNDGGYTCSPFPASYGTVKSGWQTAKDVLTVGAMNQTDYSIASFSSRGPVQDGRLKPEIVASGVNVYSTRHLNFYEYNSGTSMSGPMVAGATAILNERYRQLNGSTPRASLLKALMCNNAEDLGNPGPDYTFGFGMLNARKAVEAMEANQFIISNTTPSVTPISIPSGVRRLKVMLYWPDPAALPNAASTLVNDLDLTVTDALSNTYLPLVLDPLNVTATATSGVDHRNNIEQAVINNPAAGNYSLQVNAFSVPQGPQEYILTYALEMNGVTVEYPFGGEKLVPGESEVIRWTAYGDESNTFTVEYSTDNGSSWTLIANNVAASARSLSWTVPATLTNTAKIRVSRNASAYTDQSDYPFTILGMPVVTATVPCEGYAQLDWPAITGADGYDILQLKGDTMSVIGNTAGLTYLISGLNSSTTYWFGVAAKNSGISGRRSLSVSAIPATGTCSLAAFNNNFKAASIDAPVSGRQFTSLVLTATEPVKLSIKNLDNTASSGSYDLYYQINAATPVMESIATVIPALGSLQYSFVQTADLSAPGTYVIRAWVKRPGDAQPLDDTVSVTVKHLANPPLTLPVSDGFESMPAQEYISNTLGLEGDDRIDFKTNSARGRARSFVNTGFALQGNRAITLDQFPYGSLSTDSLLMTYNIDAYHTGNQLRFDFNYKNHGQANNPDNKCWIRGKDTDPWVLAYDLVANQAGLGSWKHASININDLLNAAAPTQTVGTSFQVKFGEQGNTSANVPFPELDQDDGYTFDDLKLAEAVNDVAITAVLSPAITGCAGSGTQTISLQIKNYSAVSFTNVPVHYSVNGGTAVDELIPTIGANATVVYNFASTATLSNNADYSFNFWLAAPGDTYQSNDSVIQYNFHTSPLISSYPYLEGFEGNDGSWYTKGSNSSWQWGSPTKTLINKAANGTKAWVTNLTGNYNNNELSYIYSPCFNLSGLVQPVLSFSMIFQIEDGCPCDYTWVDYSDDGGVTWNRLGAIGSGTNWYNDPTGLVQWRNSFNTWHVASTEVPSHSSSVRFRIAMSSDAGYNTEGVGIDDIHVFDKALVYTGTPLLNTTQTLNGSSWIDFNSPGGARIASVNPNGQNLGSTTVDVYTNSGAVRFANQQYYLDRNIVIHPTNAPVAPVSVRFYFTDTEAKNLIAATGCAGCSKPGDPYELGVTQYSGPVIEENGTLSDNHTGNYGFITAANTDIIPYNNGYYAAYSVNGFSEFWLNNGGVGGIYPLPLHLISFDAVKQPARVLLQWRTDNETDMKGFNVERSADGIHYSTIGYCVASNGAGINNYSYPDISPNDGINYYRLAIQQKDGTQQYSVVRQIIFSSSSSSISIYPNPVSEGKLFVVTGSDSRSATLYDATGSQVKYFVLQGRNNVLNLQGLSKGIYQLKLQTDQSVSTKKILLQ